MRISAENLKNECRKIWPTAFYITQAEYYWVPKLSEVEAFVKSNQVDQLPFIDGILECELYSFFLLGDVKRMGIEKKRDHWSFAKGFGLMWNGEVEQHAANIFLAQNNGVMQVYCAEPQTDYIWKADAQRDLILLADFC